MTYQQINRLEIQILFRNGHAKDDITDNGQHSTYLVDEWIKRYEANGNQLTYTAKKSSGRPRKITSEMFVDIKRWAIDDEKHANDIVGLLFAKYNIQISKRTVCRELRRHQLKPRRRCKKPMLTEQDKQTINVCIKQFVN